MNGPFHLTLSIDVVRIRRIAGLLLGAACCFSAGAGTTSAADALFKPRVIATTDGEVDDRSSMIRFLLYACDFDLAGIVEVNSKFQKNGHSKELWIQEQLKAYEQVLPHLRKHNADYPDADEIRSVLRVGNENINDLSVAPPEMETKANHAPVARVQDDLRRDVKPGETVTLAATVSDPDGDEVICKWWQYADADSAKSIMAIANSDSLDKASFVVPDEPGTQVHIILEVTDNGTPPLAGYQRIICKIK